VLLTWWALFVSFSFFSSSSFFLSHRDKILEKEREERWKQLEALCLGKMPAGLSSVKTIPNNESSQRNTEEDLKNDCSDTLDDHKGEDEPKTDSSTEKSET